jgi:VWFA-related protein
MFRLPSAFLVATFAAISIPAIGQINPPARPDATISIDAVVTAKSGPPVAGLSQSDFTVFDNKKQQPISAFRAAGGTQAPVQVLLVIDAVNAPFHAISYERQQIDKFLQADGGHLAHPVTLAIFTDTGIQIQQGGSTDGNAIAASLDHATIGLRDIRRDQGFYGAEDRLDLSLHALQSCAAKEATLPGRKLIFFVSPGWPILSGPGVELDSKQEQHIFNQVQAVSTELRRDRITLYAIDPIGAVEGIGRIMYYEEFLKGISKPSQAELGDLSLQVIAVQTGGLALSGSNDITGLLQRCMEDASAYYELSFPAPPAERPGEYHQLEIGVDKPGLIVRTRNGYYTEPDAPAMR